MQSSIIISNGMPQTVFASDKLTYILNSPLNLGGGKLISLRQANFFKSWKNITSALGNNQFNYIFNSVNFSVILTDGYYSYDDISNYFNTTMFSRGQYLLDTLGNPVYFISLSVNPIYYTIDLQTIQIPSALTGAYAGFTNPNAITLDGFGPQFILNAGTSSLFGFPAASYPSTQLTVGSYFRSTSVPNIDTTTTVLINCNLIDNQDTSFPNVIGVVNHTNFRSGELITYQLTRDMWQRSYRSVFQRIEIYFTNQLGQRLNLSDGNGISIILDLKNE